MAVHFRLEHLGGSGLAAETAQRPRQCQLPAHDARLGLRPRTAAKGRCSRAGSNRASACCRATTADRCATSARRRLPALPGGARRGLYGTNALEAQLDLLYTYCQYELARQRPGQTHLTLYRGVNRLTDHEVLRELSRGRRVVLLNNLNSFTPERERADEFGDFILAVQVPLPKVFFFHRLLPGVLKGEDEFVVIGGVAEVGVSTS